MRTDRRYCKEILIVTEIYSFNAGTFTSLPALKIFLIFIDQGNDRFSIGIFNWITVYQYMYICPLIVLMTINDVFGIRQCHQSPPDQFLIANSRTYNNCTNSYPCTSHFKNHLSSKFSIFKVYRNITCFNHKVHSF